MKNQSFYSCKLINNLHMDLFDNLEDGVSYYLNSDDMTLEVLDSNKPFNFCEDDEFEIVNIFQEFMEVNIKNINNIDDRSSETHIVFRYNNYKINYNKLYVSSGYRYDSELSVNPFFTIKINGACVGFNTIKGAELIRDYILRDPCVKRCDH